MSRRTIPLACVAALLASAVAVAPAAAISLAPEQPHSPNAEVIRSTWWVMLVIGVLAIVAVNAALIVAVVRFRERRGREPARFGAGRGALRPVIGGLSLLALAIAVFGVVRTADVRTIEPTGPEGLGGSQSAQVGVRGLPPVNLAVGEESSAAQQTASGAPPDTGVLQIDATAQQWLWRFEYPGADVNGRPAFSYGELVVPVDTAVVLDITSTDVLHTWWVPALGGQVQATPGSHSQTWFKADEVGRFEGRSTTFAGTGTPAMRSWVRVVTVPEYQDHLERLSQGLLAAQDFVKSQAAEQAGAGAQGGSSSDTGAAP